MKPSEILPALVVWLLGTITFGRAAVYYLRTEGVFVRVGWARVPLALLVVVAWPLAAVAGLLFCLFAFVCWIHERLGDPHAR